ncbi:hypothetical protein ACFWDG_21900 [Peribacillus sp. NPDC060186]
MSQKKNEQIEKAYISESIVNTVWNQYEGAIERSRKVLENQEEVYIRTLEETSKFNAELRKSLTSFYEGNKKVNADLMNSFQSNKAEEVLSEGHRSFINEGQEVVNRFENIMLTPLKSSFDIMERFEKRAVENNKAYIENLQTHRKERTANSNEYINLARTAQLRFLSRVEDGFKVMVGSGVNK